MQAAEMDPANTSTDNCISEGLTYQVSDTNDAIGGGTAYQDNLTFTCTQFTADPDVTVDVQVTDVAGLPSTAQCVVTIVDDQNVC